MSAYTLYALCFVAGPALFFVIWRFRTVPQMHCLFAALFAAFSIALSAIDSTWSNYASFGALWLGWILILVAGAAVIEQKSGLVRLSRVIGSVGVTMPWFGFAMAEMVVG